VRHTLHNFIHGPVAAQHQHQIRAFGDHLLRQFSSMARPIGRPQFWIPPYATERSFGTLKNSFGVAPDFASGGIVDED
jgi:hypothetical protein